MQNKKFDKSALTIWKQAVSEPVVQATGFDVVIHEAILNHFMVGPQYHFVFNVSIFGFESVGNAVYEILGYRPSEFTLPLFLESIHPQDRPYFLNFENKVKDFLIALPTEKLMKYKVSYDFRIRKKDDTYVRVLQQSTVIEHVENGGITRTFATHTDISHLKPDGIPSLSIIGLDGEPSYHNIDVEKVFFISPEVLTTREKEILRLLASGRFSKQIASQLGISKQTVDKHRKNMLAKSGMNTTSMLIAKAAREGWL